MVRVVGGNPRVAPLRAIATCDGVGPVRWDHACISQNEVPSFTSSWPALGKLLRHSTRPNGSCSLLPVNYSGASMRRASIASSMVAPRRSTSWW